MRRVVDARHVLMIVDQNYVDRADNHPNSGVAIENGWIQDVFPNKPATWLSVLLKDNSDDALPKWLSDHKPKGHWFNADLESNWFPGADQIEELWRWVEDLPSYRGNATPIATLRKRAARLERIDAERDPANWRSPALAGEVHFNYAKAPGNAYWMGYGNFEFALEATAGGPGSIYVYADKVKAIGLIRSPAVSPDELESHLTPGRSIMASQGRSVVLMNENGVLCHVEITRVQGEVIRPAYVEPSVDFRYEIMTAT